MLINIISIMIGIISVFAMLSPVYVIYKIWKS